MKPARTVTLEDADMVRALGRYSAACRQLLGLSQMEVARQSGHSQGAISRLESAKCYAIPLVSYRAVVRLYAALGARTQTPLPVVGTLLEDPTALVPTVDPQRLRVLALFDACPPRARVHLLEVMGHLVDLVETTMHPATPGPGSRPLELVAEP